MTAALIVVSAGGFDDPTADTALVRRRDGKDQETFIRLRIRNVLNGLEPDLYLQPNDEVMLQAPPATTNRAGK